MTFLQWFGLLVLTAWGGVVWLYQWADHRPNDDFGAGVLFWLGLIVAFALTGIWIIVAGIKTVAGW